MVMEIWKDLLNTQSEQEITKTEKKFDYPQKIDLADDNAYISTLDGEKMFGISRITIFRWIRDGKLNATKFTALVASLKDKVDPAEMPTLLGFVSEREFLKYIVEEKDKPDTSFLDSLIDESRKEKHGLDSLSDVITTLFSDSKKTIEQDYLVFTYKGSMITVVLCDDNCKKTSWKGRFIFFNSKYYYDGQQSYYKGRKMKP